MDHRGDRTPADGDPNLGLGAGPVNRALGGAGL